METATAIDLLRCHPAVGPEPGRIGLVLDYRGDQPPLRLFDLLRRHGWITPAPHAPPAKAIDWDNDDPVTGRRWSLRPYVVSGALAVPGPATPPNEATAGWLDAVLHRIGVELSATEVRVGSLRETQPGLAEVLVDDGGRFVDPFHPEDVARVAPVRPDLPVRPVAPRLEPAVVDVVEQVVQPTLHHDVEPSPTPLVWSPPDPSACCRIVNAVVRRGVVGKVAEVLEARDLDEVALLSAVSGWGRGGGRVTRYRGRQSVEDLQRIHVQVPVHPDDAEDLVAAIVQAARVGEKGDGKVWVT